MDFLNNSLSGIQTSITPYAKRTARIFQEKFGSAEDVTQLPKEYVDLETRVDSLKDAENKLLDVTSTYSNEGYDYPANIRESFFDLSKEVQEKARALTHANSAAEAQAALLKSGPKRDPKTLNHAISRAAYAGAASLPENDHFAQALAKLSAAEAKIGDARLAQDAAIVSKFNAAVSTTLNTSLQFATKARRNVTNARLSLDAAKADAKIARPEKEDAARVEVEQAEDDFVAATEDAVSVMKNVIETPEPIRNLTELVAAQLAFHKAAYEALQELAPEIEALQIKQENDYRTSRETS